MLFSLVRLVYNLWMHRSCREKAVACKDNEINLIFAVAISLYFFSIDYYMRTCYIKYAVISLLTAFAANSAPAADLPKLKASKNISSGTLANGVNYYIVTNPSYKGMADIALVQKAGYSDENEKLRGTATVNARGSLTELQHFTGMTPFSYLKGKSVYPSGQGFVKVNSDASVYRFENIVQARKSDIIDSTLLMVFDIIGREGGKMSEFYNPNNQAVIISGDINESEIRGKMEMLSMFIAKKDRVERKREYQWQDKDEMKVRTIHSWTRNTVSAEYRYPRTPEEDMATVLPLVTSRYASELEILLRRRLSRALRSEGIAYSGIDFTYRSSAGHSGDELFRVSISTSAGNLEKATQILAATLADIDVHGASKEEFSEIENELMLQLNNRYGAAVVENSKYVDKCIAAFLYGSSLASDEDNLKFFSSRNLDGETSVRLFNNFVSALLDKSKNLSLICETNTSEDTAEKIKTAFESAWSAPEASSSHSFSADSALLYKASGKTKLRLSSSEPLFGGEIWTYANGVKVIYKKVDNGGFLHYSWLVKGGYTNMQNLKDGEGAYLSDILGTFKVAGIEGNDFAQMLNSNGITMDIHATPSEFNVSGSAKAEKFPLLMKALLSLANGRSTDAEAFKYYRRCESLRTAESSIEAKLDSIMDKDLLLSGFKRPARLSDDLQARAGKFYDDIFSRMNDGALIIVGDIEAETLKKTLLQYIGAFKTEKAYAYRSRTKGGTIDSRVTEYDWGRDPKIGISLSAPINYTADNFMASHIAAIAVEDAVAGAVAQSGWTVSASQDVRMFPEESLTIDMILSKASPAGFPASLMSVDSSEIVLSQARKAISDIGSKGLSADELNVGKTLLNNHFTSWLDDPQTIIRMLVLRYSYGKDIVSDYSKKISNVTAGTVNPILSSLAEGGIAEYVIRKSNSQDYTEVPVKDNTKLKVEALKPIPDSFYYPFDGSEVPADSTGLSIAEIDELLPITGMEEGMDPEAGTEENAAGIEEDLEEGLEGETGLAGESGSAGEGENSEGEAGPDKEGSTGENSTAAEGVPAERDGAAGFNGSAGGNNVAGGFEGRKSPDRGNEGLGGKSPDIGNGAAGGKIDEDSPAEKGISAGGKSLEEGKSPAGREPEEGSN